MIEANLRGNFDRYLSRAEVAIYSSLAVLLSITVIAGIASASKLLWEALIHWSITAETLAVLNELLIVLMLVEILHTVRISIRSHVLVMEPFLVIGLIASIRRVLVISLEMATLNKQGSLTQENDAAFRHSMIELAMLGLLIFLLVYSITLVRRYPPQPESEDLENLSGRTTE